LLELVGIADLAKRYPRQLSGGQQSRAALARVLLPWPPALLMDEPFAALDAITREELQDDLLRLVSLRKTTVLFVTHDITEAVYLGDQVAVMEQGQISRVVTIDLKAPRGKNFRHQTNFSIYCQSIREAMVQKMPEVM
jgi:NitT/TauT family transport system ATP-binding protein